MMHRPIVVTIALAALSGAVGCRTSGTESASGTSVAATWSEGYFSIGSDERCGFVTIGHPGTRKECLRLGAPASGEPVPAVIFLHGCLGWNARQARVMNLVKESGYPVFSPNSFARPGRSQHCRSVFPNSLRYRLEEIDYAVARLRELPWIDQSRLILAGFSEGGVAAAQYSGTAFRAILVLGWGCGRGSIRAPKNTPVLNIVGKNDRETSFGPKLCRVSGRPNSKAVRVASGHDVAEDPASADLIRDFLANVM